MSRDSSLGIPFDKFFSICGNYDSVIYGRALRAGQLLAREVGHGLNHSFAVLRLQTFRQNRIKGEAHQIYDVSAATSSTLYAFDNFHCEWFTFSRKEMAHLG